MSNKIRNSLIGIGTGVGITIALSQGLSQENSPSLETLSEKQRQVIIKNINNILKEENITLSSGNNCIITIIGNKASLQAILACNETTVFPTHKKSIKDGESYVAQVTGLISQKDGTLNPNQGCLRVEAYGKQVEHGPNCSSPSIDDQKPFRKIPTIKA